jgi:hypothetical protein
MNEPNNGTSVPIDGIRDQEAYSEYMYSLHHGDVCNYRSPYVFTFGEPWPKQEEADIENVVGVFYD